MNHAIPRAGFFEQDLEFLLPRELFEQFLIVERGVEQPLPFLRR